MSCCSLRGEPGLSLRCMAHRDFMKGLMLLLLLLTIQMIIFFIYIAIHAQILDLYERKKNYNRASNMMQNHYSIDNCD